MKRILLYVSPSILGIVAIAVFARTLMHAVIGEAAGPNDLSTLTVSDAAPAPKAKIAASSTIAAVTDPIPGYYPSRISIPSIDINASVQKVGLNANYAISPPTNFTDVGWYEYSAAPGQNGSAIIDGHVDNGLGLSGVFKHLSDLHTGDDIYVTTRSGAKLDFVVTSIASYDYQHVPLEAILAKNDSAGITLITCEGTWVSDQRTYNERLVVSAVLRDQL